MRLLISEHLEACSGADTTRPQPCRITASLAQHVKGQALLPCSTVLPRSAPDFERYCFSSKTTTGSYCFSNMTTAWQAMLRPSPRLSTFSWVLALMFTTLQGRKEGGRGEREGQSTGVV